jgi:DNA-binding response OmpR family regulator
LDICRREKPGLVLLDLHMPGMDGLEACRIIKKDNDISSARVVFVTASTSGLEAKKIEAGADDYMIKPFQTEELAGKVRNAFGD